MVQGQTMAQFAEESGGGEFIDAVIEETVVLNSHLTSSQLKEGITMDRNDPTQIKDVDFSELGIKALPEIFGHLKISGDLNLSYNNALTSLPESMGSMKVGGHLNLSRNALTSLPESMGSMKVGGYLSLSRNALTSLPESMGSIQVGGHLMLYDNNLPDPKPTKADFPNVEGDVFAVYG